MNKNKFRFKLEGKTAVFIDWANVYGWKKSLKREIDPKKLFSYLKHYPEIKEINFYFGLDKHPKSKVFLDKIRRVGFRVVTKEVKYIPIGLDSSHFKDIYGEVKESLSVIKKLEPDDLEKILHILNQKTLRRKCDFDMEICIDAHGAIKESFETFLFFSGDGDFEPLYKLLVEKNKQVVVVYAHGHLGKEVWNIKKGVYKRAIDALGEDLFV